MLESLSSSLCCFSQQYNLAESRNKGIYLHFYSSKVFDKWNMTQIQTL